MKSAKKLPLTDRQAQLVGIVQRYRFTHSRAPSQKELAEELGCSPSTARNCVKICRTKGALTDGRWEDLDLLQDAPISNDSLAIAFDKLSNTYVDEACNNPRVRDLANRIDAIFGEESYAAALAVLAAAIQREALLLITATQEASPVAGAKFVDVRQQVAVVCNAVGDAASRLDVGMLGAN